MSPSRSHDVSNDDDERDVCHYRHGKQVIDKEPDVEECISSGSFVEPFRSDHRMEDDESVADSVNNARHANETLLGTACLTFMTFACVQMAFAFIADSQAMVGDSSAMLVDAFTYALNWMAELRKNRPDRPPSEGATTSLAQRLRARRKLELQLELLPPLISVTTLLAVTLLVLHDSVQTFVSDVRRSRDDQSIPNLNVMLIFSSLNLSIDVLNLTCFAQARHLFGYHTVDVEHCDEGHRVQLSADSPLRRHEQPNQASDGVEAPEINSDHSVNQLEHRSNLNMCSAYTHVFADTLRSLAVLCAAAVAKVSDNVSADEADSGAAILVSAVILLSLVPLFRGMARTYAELRAILQEEESERLIHSCIC